MATGVDKQKPLGGGSRGQPRAWETFPRPPCGWREVESMSAIFGELQELMRQKGKERSRWGRRRKEGRKKEGLMMGWNSSSPDGSMPGGQANSKEGWTVRHLPAGSHTSSRLPSLFSASSGWVWNEDMYRKDTQWKLENFEHLSTRRYHTLFVMSLPIISFWECMHLGKCGLPG